MFFKNIDVDYFIILLGATFRRVLKPVFYCVVGFAIVWFVGLKRYTYQQLFGKPFNKELQISSKEVYIDLPPDNFRTATIEGYKIKFKLLKQYYATGRVIYVDRYTNPFGRFYRNSGPSKLANKAYDEVVPQDITFVVGDFARYPKLKGSHDYRAGGLDYDDEYTYGIYQKHHDSYSVDLTNIHTIAASTTVQKGLDILKAGDVATLEGYLIYWETRLENGQVMDFRSAVFAGEKHTKHKYGGISGVGLCKQLLLTRIIFDGRVFE